MHKDYYNKVYEVLQKEPFSISGTLVETQMLKDIEGWDSLKHLSFFLEIEDQFSVEFTPEEYSEIETIRDLVTSLRGKC